MLTHFDQNEIGNRANSYVQQLDFVKFGELMLHDLDAYRRSIPEEAWRNTVIELRQMPFYPISQEDPASSHSTKKPRGYAGDAHLIDFLYRSDCIGNEVIKSTPAGQAIYNFWMNSPAARGVRNRREYFSRQLVRAVTRNRNARILVLASGHFREGDIIIANEAFADAAVTCLDQDPLSCEEVKRRFAKCKVTVLNRNVTAALGLTETNYDLIYAAGLYDYLSEKVAIRLNAHLISILAPGGRLVVPNFLQSAPNRASMELLQDWFLIYRDENEIRRLVAKALDSHQQISYFETEDASIGYAILDR
jgi:hypothetical protein